MNGTALMIQEMNIRKRSDGRFEGRMTVNGVRKSFYGKTESEVKKSAKAYLNKVESGFRDPKKILFSEFVEYWLMSQKWKKIDDTSFTRLYRVYDKQIRNTIGEKYIGKITTEDIQKLIDDHANPKDAKVKPLAMSGLKRIMHLLAPCFRFAVKKEVIQNNPCDGVILPKEGCIKIETKEQFSLTDEEIAAFKEIVFTRYKTTNEYVSRDFFVLLIILNLGLRVGEMLALEWSNINYDKKLVYIGKTVQSNIQNFDKNAPKAIYSKVKKTTKTKHGERFVPLNDAVISYFRELEMYDKRNGIVSQYVCAAENGKRKSARNIARSLDRLLRMADGRVNPNTTPHTLRHTFGSTLLRRGVQIEVVSRLMGHANITITYNKYIHVIQEQQALAMSMVTIC